MSGQRGVFGYIHEACGHASSEHGLDADAASVEGPYSCRHCDCKMMQSDPQRGYDPATFMRLTATLNQL